MEMSIFLSLAFTEILHFTINNLGLTFLYVLKYDICCFVLCGRYVPLIHTSAKPALVRARNRLLPDSQSGITSRMCGLRGRPQGFRVPFGTGPIS